jgi:Protein of unknown function (DUF998)
LKLQEKFKPQATLSMSMISSNSVWNQRLALAGILLSSMLMAALHFLEPQLNPLQIPISEYAIQKSGWLMTLAFFWLSFGSWCLYSRLRNTPVFRAWNLGINCFKLWVGGTAIAGIFPTDARDAIISWHGTIHGMGASLALGSLIVLEFAIVRKDIGRPLRLRSAIIASLNLLALAVMFGTGLFGLFERVVICLHLVWLLAMTVFSKTVQT